MTNTILLFLFIRLSETNNWIVKIILFLTSVIEELNFPFLSSLNKCITIDLKIERFQGEWKKIMEIVRGSLYV